VNPLGVVVQVSIEEIDPIRDLALLRVRGRMTHYGERPRIGSFDDVKVTEQVVIVGYPHATDQRLVLTYQPATLGAKVLLTPCAGFIG
jgi:hypothetical protein